MFPFLPFLGFLFILMECLCFVGAAFVGTELWLHLTNGTLTAFPTDLRPYIFGLVIGIAFFLLNILFRRKIFAMHSKPNLLVK